MAVHIVKNPLKKKSLSTLAAEDFGDMVKGVVDVQHGIMTLGGELHVDGETLLMEQEGSLREHTWGINIYPNKPRSEWLEFDSLVNLKPSFGNRSRRVENEGLQKEIVDIVNKLILD